VFFPIFWLVPLFWKINFFVCYKLALILVGIGIPIFPFLISQEHSIFCLKKGRTLPNFLFDYSRTFNQTLIEQMHSVPRILWKLIFFRLLWYLWDFHSNILVYYWYLLWYRFLNSWWFKNIQSSAWKQETLIEKTCYVPWIFNLLLIEISISSYLLHLGYNWYMMPKKLFYLSWLFKNL
jgi:hypothetical protein